MNREDLGKMLEANLGWPVVQGGLSPDYKMMFDIELQRGAKGFWNDVIDVLIGNAHLDENMRGIDRSDTVQWLEDQKIGDDE